MSVRFHSPRSAILPTRPNPRRPAHGAILLLAAALCACNTASPPAPASESPLVLDAHGPCIARGRVGGTTAPNQWELRLFNRSGASAPWKVASDRSWLVLPVAEGVLAPRASIQLLGVLDVAAVRDLAAGSHLAHVALVGRDTGAVEIGLDLDVAPRSDEERGRASRDTAGAGPYMGADLSAPPAGEVVSPETGWTNLVPSADSRLVHVSSSRGDDRNDGLSPEHPKATIAAAKALLRNGHPDWLLLRRGDVWTSSIGQWITSGRSETEPAVITSYDSAAMRPRIATGLEDGLVTLQTAAGPARLQHVRIVGLHFICNGYTGAEGTPHGIVWHVPFDDLLVEDCFFERFHTNVVIEPLTQRGHDFRMRRCIVVDAFSTQSSHPQGLYVSGTDDVLLQENVFDHNGWREDVSGAVPTIFRHNVYLQSDVSGVRALGNIFASGASHGLQVRSGGQVDDNLFVNNAIALLLGTSDPVSAPIRFEARRNVILSGRDISPATPRGFGIDVPAADSGLIAGNVIADQGRAGFPVAMSLYDGRAVEGFHDVVVEDNVIHDWRGPVIVQGAPPSTDNLVFRRNVISEPFAGDPLLHSTAQPNASFVHSADNRLWSRRAPQNAWCRIGASNVSLDAWLTALADTSSTAARPNFVDPQRTLKAYDLSIGGAGSMNSFLSAARKLGKGQWNQAYTGRAVAEWVRAGFQVAN